MFISILRTAIRNFFRNRGFSVINLFGLSVSMSLGLLIITVVSEQYTYDQFHTEPDRIFRINTRAIRVSGGTEDYASVPLPVATALRDEYALTDDVVRFDRGLRGDAVYENVTVPVSGYFADPSILKVFNLQLAAGNPETALSEPNNLVLTDVAAKKIFGERPALGSAIRVNGYGDFVVAGVLQPFPGKTHFDFEVLGSSSAIAALEKNGSLTPALADWANYYSGYIYVKVKEGRTVEELSKALDEIVENRMKRLKLESRTKALAFYPQALSEITPGPALSNAMGNGMPELVIIFLGALAAIVMLMACLNYTNLTIAKSLTRAREIGVRKLMGAGRWQVFIQFISEAVVFSIMALMLSYLFLQVLKPGYMQLDIARTFETSLTENISLYILFVCFALAVGLIAGLLPAGYLSAFKPVSVLKDAVSVKVYSRLTFRKALIVVQFSLSLIFIIVVLVIYNQIDYMVSKDYGINDKNILNIRLQGQPYERIANEVSSLPGVIKVGGVSHALGTWADRASDYKRTKEEESFGLRDFIVTREYVDNLQLQFAAGSNFADMSQREAIINERALSFFRFSQPLDAIGETIITNDSTELKIIGVVKDFNFRPLSYEIGPLVLRQQDGQLGYASLQIDPAQKSKLMSQLPGIWKRLDPVHPLDMRMMEDEIDDAYASGGFKDILTIISYISFLTLTLACLGMVGMSMYAIQTRIKEIGIRKVMGGSSREIMYTLSRQFMVLIVLAIVIGVPAGYFVSQLALSSFAYRIPISISLIGGGVMTIVVLGLLTIGSQTWRATSINPVDTLRHE